MLNANNKNYILVHGAWHGSWCWEEVALKLKQLGHNVLTPDLPGHYNNKCDFKYINLSKYVDYITQLVKNSPDNMILVGHSMAGVIISQVAENIPDKIDHLIYISAFIPQDKSSLLDEEKQAKIPTVSLAITVDESECAISLKDDPKQIRELFFNCCNDSDAAYALSNLQKQPLHPFIDKASLSNGRFGNVSKLYIECLQDNAIRIEDQRRMHSKTAACNVKTLDTDHSPFFSAVDGLIRLIVGS